MPKYHFTTDDGKPASPDVSDHEFPNDRAASDAAQEALADMAHDALPDGSAVDLNADVDDAEGARIYEASLKFRGKTGEEIQADHAQREADAEEATEAIVRALNGTEPRRS